MDNSSSFDDSLAAGSDRWSRWRPHPPSAGRRRHSSALPATFGPPNRCLRSGFSGARTKSSSISKYLLPGSERLARSGQRSFAAPAGRKFRLSWFQENLVRYRSTLRPFPRRSRRALESSRLIIEKGQTMDRAVGEWIGQPELEDFNQLAWALR